MKAFFATLAEKLGANKDKILEELTVIQGKAVDLGGYFHAPASRVTEIMQPSATLNKLMEEARASV